MAARQCFSGKGCKWDKAFHFGRASTKNCSCMGTALPRSGYLLVAPGRGVAATGGGGKQRHEPRRGSMFFTTGNAKSTEHGTPMGFKTFFPLPPVALRATGGYQQTTPYGVKIGMFSFSPLPKHGQSEMPWQVGQGISFGRLVPDGAVRDLPASRVQWTARGETAPPLFPQASAASRRMENGSLPPFPRLALPFPARTEARPATGKFKNVCSIFSCKQQNLKRKVFFAPFAFFAANPFPSRSPGR